MTFFTDLLTGHSVAQAVFVYSLVIALGLAVGSVPVFGVRLGVAGVLFSGILFGHFQISINPEVLEFTRELGLILFVYSIGLQVGPGFFRSFRHQGVTLNLVAAFVVIFGAVIALGLSFFAGIPLPAALGLFSGATTNTPSLGATQQALKEIPNISPDLLNMPGLGYAVAYPFGIMGIILVMLITRFAFRLNPHKEAEFFAQLHSKGGKLETLEVRVDNPNLNGLTVEQLPTLKDSGVVVSRVMRDGKVQVALDDTKIFTGDILRLVGAKKNLQDAQIIVGSKAKIDMNAASGGIEARRLVVTKHDVDGKTIEDLDTQNKYGITITRVMRAEFELAATEDTELHLADVIVVVGDKENLNRFAKDVGNAPKQLDHPLVMPIFVGIALGVLLGSWPLHIPGVPVPVKLGLAGGPLLVAIFLSYVGRIGKLIWYMPSSANFMLREIGIVLFLACVGIKSGGQFVHTLLQGDGFYWMGCATIITVLPILVAALYLKLRLKLNYLTICGILAGSMTDPPALAFANSMTQSNAPSIAYATVYPLVMLLRVVSAQIIVIFFMR
ncbi:MAG: putative transporter [Candidatus Omnitrophota bacterium]|nr:putative transporter [Candidatus Omnitrophota bacterium]MDZ4242853.1 putative transporter [Candidatus Omnitrophota bacterium]